MNALITGAAGQLGSDLLAAIPDATGLDREQLSITDDAAVGRALGNARPSVVFNCAAYNAVDRAEHERDLAWSVNAVAPGALARACAARGIHLVHFSTNFVFAGDAAEPYSEDDAPHPLSVYARSKLEGERGVLANMPSALVVRSAGLYGVRGSRAKGGSFPERILAAARRGEPLRVVDDQRLNPTWTAPLAQASIDLVNEGAHGIVHVVADGCCSWWDFATATLRVAGVDAPVTRLSTNELNAPAQRPRNGCLRSVRVVALPPWRDELAGWFSEYRSRSA